jgi:hypothetical protein
MRRYHFPDRTRQRIRHLLLTTGLSGKDIADACGCSRSGVSYQRHALALEGFHRPSPDVAEPFRGGRQGADCEPGAFSQQLCLVGGCISPAASGKFCAVHDTAVMIAKATAGMSEATRRKLVGAR